MDKLKNSNACGIDISAKEHVVAVPQDRDSQCIRTFCTFTQDLHQLANWLLQCKVDSVVMESTGVYWYHLYTVLLEYDLEVFLVNAQHVKRVPGRKSDVSDARWLQQLHSFGLLNGCFQPDNLTRELRDYVRLRKSIIRDMSKQRQRAQKALELMNIKLNLVISDITGKSGSNIIQAILNGKRDPHTLIKYADGRLKGSREALLKALEGNWREEQIFNLKVAWEHYKFLSAQLEQCDQQSENTLTKFQTIEDKQLPDSKTRSRNQPKFNVRNYLFGVLGTDVLEINGFKETSALTVFSETGPMLQKKFPTDKQFCSWLNLVPDNKISGGKILSSKVKKKKNNAGQSFREAAFTLWKSKCPLGDYLRMKKAKSGAKAAITATARKIAAIYYKMVTDKVAFDNAVLIQKSRVDLLKKVMALERSLSLAKIQLAGTLLFVSFVI